MKHFLFALLLVGSWPGTESREGLMTPLSAQVPPTMKRPAPDKPTTWDLVVFNSLPGDCLDTTRAESWKSLETISSGMFAFDRRKPDVLEEHNGKAILYEFKPKGKKYKYADALVTPTSFLFVATYFPDEPYEEKIVFRTDRVLVLASGPANIRIYFNRANPPDSLTSTHCLRLMLKAGQLFNQPAPPCK